MTCQLQHVALSTRLASTRHSWPLLTTFGHSTSHAYLQSPQVITSFPEASNARKQKDECLTHLNCFNFPTLRHALLWFFALCYGFLHFLHFLHFFALFVLFCAFLRFFALFCAFCAFLRFAVLWDWNFKLPYLCQYQFVWATLYTVLFSGFRTITLTTKPLKKQAKQSPKNTNLPIKAIASQKQTMLLPQLLLCQRKDLASCLRQQPCLNLCKDHKPSSTISNDQISQT